MRRSTSSVSCLRPRAAGFLVVLPALLLILAMFSCARDRALSRYGEVADKIRRTGLTDEKAYDILRKIMAGGPRLTGSPEAAAAVELTRKIMKGMGFDNVHLEPITVNRRVRGAKESS